MDTLPRIDTSRFDTVAATWDEDPNRIALARAVGAAIAERMPLSPTAQVMDYGCGTGLLTLALAPHVGHLTGADTSAGMLAMAQQKIAAAGIGHVSTMLLEAGDGYRIAGEYDGIVSSMTLHHVPEPDRLMKDFRAHLRPGGFVALADLDREDGTFHKPGITDVYHLGFDRAQVRAWLEAGGFTDVQDTTVFVHKRNGREYPVFLITART
jgi:2-polyprenyl-3-methyl-5-hydroxy-6-metoxy-1,4-benzoquinol methylase